MADYATFSRRNFLKGAALLAASVPLASLLSACSDSAATQAGSGAGSSILVAYYSAQGHTESVANTIADETGADIFVITPSEPYTRDDLNYNNDSSRVSVEHENPDDRNVELETITPDNFDSYSTIFIGYPIWWAQAAWPIDNFITGNDFSGKTVIPFCTSASSPLGDSGTNLAAMAGTGDWQEGMRFRSSVDESDVRDWVQGLNL